MRPGLRLMAASCVLVFVLSFGLTAFASPPGPGWMPPGQAKKGDKYGWLFLDADQAPWAFPYLAELAVKGVFRGDNGLVRPNQPVTIVEAITLCVRLLGLEEEALARSNAPLPYANARSIPAWARGYVAVALERGLIAPHGDLQPNRSAERLTVAVMVIRALGREAEAQTKMGQVLPFRDAATVPPWAVGYLVVALDLGILTGYPGGTLQPHKPVTRAEMAALLSRAGQYLDGRHRSEVVGEVTAVSATAPRTLTLRHAAGTTTYPVAPYCAVYAGAVEKRFDDLRPGDRVKAYLNADGEVVFVAIQPRAQVRQGTLHQIVPPAGSAAGYVAVTDLQGNRVRWALAPGAQAVNGGQVVPFAELQVGLWVKVHLEGELAVTIELVNASPERGMVVETGADPQGRWATLKLQLAQGGTAVFPVLANAQVTYQGQAATFASLRPGDQVEISFQAGRVDRITILVRTAAVTGAVQSTQVNQQGQPLSITLRSGHTYPVAADVVVTSPAGQPIAFTALRPGDQVELHLEEQVVRRIQVGGQTRPVTGTVTAIARNPFGHPESITLQVNGGSQTYAVAVDVRVTLNGVPMEFSAILPADRATLTLQGDLVREIAISARPEVITGEVVARTVNSFGHPESITIRLADGRQQRLPVAVTVEVAYEGDPTTFVSILVGDRVELTVEGGRVIRIEVATRTQTLSGTVRSRELNPHGHPDRIALEGHRAPYPVAVTVIVTYQDNPLPFADLRPGDRVEMGLEAGVVVSIRVLSRAGEVTGALVERTVNAFGHPVSITVRNGGHSQMYPVAPDIQVYRNGAPAAFASLLVEDYVLAELREDRVIRVTVLVRADAFTGVIKGLNEADRTLLVRVTATGAGGLPFTLDRLVKVTAATAISRGRQTLTFADLALEQSVALTATIQDGQFTALTLVIQ